MDKKLLALIIIVFAIIVLVGFAWLASIFFGGESFSSSGGFLSFGPSIAIIPIKGEIVSGAPYLSSSLSSQEIIDSIDEAENDPSVSAILLDIDSPGGAIVPTKQIVAKLKETKKPKVSWIADICTSGAYYIASASDFIMADEDSITGSIGVISIAPDINGLMEKLGVKVKIIKEGKYKALGNPFEELSAEEEQLIQEILSDAFSHFKRDVLKFRAGKISQEKFGEVADGRILSGAQAKKAGLIDALGTRDKAILKAGELAGIKGEPSLKVYGKKQLSFSDLFSQAGFSFGSGFITAVRPANLQPSIQAK
ncbi:MAG: signal peptide peptidase SppA [Candidatus Diapherotrites archaeon]